MSEAKFAMQLAAKLKPFVGECSIDTKRAVFYTLSFDDQGNLQPSMGALKIPARGGGTGFEQDILIYERLSTGDTQIIPRVIAEVKFGRVTTHDSIVYSEKARRIREIYPFVRYGLILGELETHWIPGRVLRLGQEFDFVVVVKDLDTQVEILGSLFAEELQISRDLAALLTGDKKASVLRRSLSTTSA